MIAKLTGEILEVRPGHIIVDVQGVGYIVAIRSTDLYIENSRVSLYTHLAVRENALDLYGFQTFEAYSMFEHLIKIPKIGPKTAMQILSQADVSVLMQAVQNDDAGYLSKVSGIGKKSAENIVNGLKSRIDESEFGMAETPRSIEDGDVIETLITLGYSQKDAFEAVQKIPANITGTNERIKHALKYVG
jgi:holliday junction DNA helicase RuvA